MTINVSNLELTINKKLRTATNEGEILMLSSALALLKTGAVYSVAAYTGLPPANENKGDLYYVESLNTLYYSNGQYFVQVAESSTNELWMSGWYVQGVYGNNTGFAKGTWYSSPAVVSTGWKTIAATAQSSTMLALKPDGTLWTWGQGLYGSIGTGSTINVSSPVTTIGGGTWASINTSYLSVHGIKSDGTLWSWGYGAHGQLGNNTAVNASSPVTTAGGGTNWKFVGRSGGPIVGAIKTDGTLWTWGINNYGQIGDNQVAYRSSPVTTAGGGTTWCQFGGGYVNAAAIKTDGTLWTWGYSAYGGLGDNQSAICRSSPNTTAGGGTTWCLVAGQNTTMAAIKTDGTLWTFGGGCTYGTDGGTAPYRVDLNGSGTTVWRSSPNTILGGGTTWCSIALTSITAGALKTDGTMWVWGCNCLGQLGVNNTINVMSPVTVAGDKQTWQQIALNMNAHAALSSTLY